MGKAILTHESYGKKIIIELANEDITMDQFYETCMSLALAVGYHPDTVNEYFKD